MAKSLFSRHAEQKAWDLLGWASFAACFPLAAYCVLSRGHNLVAVGVLGLLALFAEVEHPWD
jgi:hypothetical protein